MCDVTRAKSPIVEGVFGRRHTDSKEFGVKRHDRGWARRLAAKGSVMERGAEFGRVRPTED